MSNFIGKNNDIYTVQEVAEYLRVSKNTIYEAIHCKKLNAIKIKSTYRITKEDLLIYIRKNLTIDISIK